MQTRVFQIALSKGFPNIPHIPPPLGHSAGTNEATMTTPENAPCWQVPQRPREIFSIIAVIVLSAVLLNIGLLVISRGCHNKIKKTRSVQYAL